MSTKTQERFPVGEAPTDRHGFPKAPSREIGVDRCEACECWIAWGPDAFVALAAADLKGGDLEDCRCRCHDTWRQVFAKASP